MAAVDHRDQCQKQIAETKPGQRPVAAGPFERQAFADPERAERTQQHADPDNELGRLYDRHQRTPTAINQQHAAAHSDSRLAV